jgi:hypothetical protein
MSPWICRWTIMLASRVAPARTRAEWRALWESGLRNWCILVDRGELTMRSSGEVCRAALADAWSQRFGAVPWDRALGGPSLPLLASVAAIALVGWASRGFAYIRTVPDEADRAFGHFFVLAFTLLAAALMMLFRGAKLHARGWRLRAHLGLKTSLALLALTLACAEGGAWLRRLIGRPEPSALVGGVAWSALYLAAFLWLAAWCFSDQSQRCPVCLRRLVSPVSIGAWSSVFEPATTERVCADGHGLLCSHDQEGDGETHWTALDASWKGL